MARVNGFGSVRRAFGPAKSRRSRNSFPVDRQGRQPNIIDSRRENSRGVPLELTLRAVANYPAEERAFSRTSRGVPHRAADTIIACGSPLQLHGQWSFLRVYIGEAVAGLRTGTP